MFLVSKRISSQIKQILEHTIAGILCDIVKEIVRIVGGGEEVDDSSKWLMEELMGSRERQRERDESRGR